MQVEECATLQQRTDEATGLDGQVSSEETNTFGKEKYNTLI